MLLNSINPAIRPGVSVLRPAGLQGTATASNANPSTPVSDPEDLNAEIRAQVEQDPDYQILRRAFKLSGELDERSDDSVSPPQVQSGEPEPFIMPKPPPGLQVQGLQIQISQRFELAIHVEGSAVVFQQLALEINGQSVQQGDPLVLDLGGRGITTTGISDGVDFDLDGDGRLERMSTVYGQTWFLALDHNDNGRIDDGRELFGDQNGAAHGFAELGRYDDNGDGRIDRQDQVFSRLRLLQLGARGTQDIQTLDQAGVKAIELNYREVQRALSTYDQIAQSGRFVRADGTTGEAADLLLGYRRLV